MQRVGVEQVVDLRSIEKAAEICDSIVPGTCTAVASPSRVTVFMEISAESETRKGM